MQFLRSSWSEPQSAPGLGFADRIELLHLWLHKIYIYKCSKICIFSLYNSLLLLPYSKKDGIEYVEGPLLVSNDDWDIKSGAIL